LKESYKDISRTLVRFHAPSSPYPRSLRAHQELISIAWVRSSGTTKSFAARRSEGIGNDNDNDKFYGEDINQVLHCFSWDRIEKVDIIAEQGVAAMEMLTKFVERAPMAALLRASKMIGEHIENINKFIDAKSL